MEAQSLTRALGGVWRAGAGLARCPAHEDRAPSLSIREGEGGRLLLHCFAGCVFAEILDALRERGALSDCGRPEAGAVSAPDPAQEEAATRKTRRALALWEASEPLSGSPAEAYLRGRGLYCASPQTLRFHPACPHPNGGRAPAMLARVDGGAGFALHRTFLRAQGREPPEPRKAMLGAVAGGGVRLASGSEALAVAEGIETALSLSCGLLAGELAIWAALSASGMKALRLPPARGRKLILATDGDKPGREAGEALAERALAEGWRVFLLPAPDGADWNDVLRERSADHERA